MTAVRRRRAWPAVIAVIPARDEAESVGADASARCCSRTIPAPFSIILVDDQSSDGTADVARQRRRRQRRIGLTVVPGAALPAGWTGKLWAMKQGVDARARERRPAISCSPTPTSSTRPTRSRVSSPRREADGLVLNSLMVKLRCESLAERALHSGLRLLLPDALPLRLGQPAGPRPPRLRPAAACWCAATRCAAAGGIEAIRGALIDDCALARALKPQGPIRLGLTERAHSIRAYPGVGGHPPHGGALGLCPARLFAAAACRHASPAWR